MAVLCGLRCAVRVALCSTGLGWIRYECNTQLLHDAEVHGVASEADDLRTRDATFGKMANQNQTDSNEVATMTTKYQTDFYSAEKYQYLTKF